MPVSPSIKNALEDVVERLRARAARHRRALQRELLAIVEAAVRPAQPPTPDEAMAEVQCQGLDTPAEAATIVRANRDGH